MKQLVVGVLAHVDAGKTTLSEAMLYTSGMITIYSGGRILSSEKYLLPEGSGRSLLVIEKTAPTPAKYPRGQNKPRLSPIG